ncbi:hypothetical protein EPT53_05890 [Fusobacterium necrophorum]|uniref:YjcQ protein n=1 Tax=Fusobacterium necrophorum TaxID=859 RepID=A0A4Q2KXW5_9FUSO|nr:YjcQ family protein [Fusobacterium necrophorum]RXZ69819.1 hypothetical protein EPT53_05890 [Fusobacterium necrophorum]
MKNYFVSLYQVLKVVELASYQENTYSYQNFFDLEKLQLTEKELNIIIRNAVTEKLVTGIALIEGFGFKVIVPQLTTAGYEFLENNSQMKQAYKILKEIKGWIPGMN